MADIPMIKSINDTEKRLVQLKQAVPTRGMERHPTILKDVSELPIELQSPEVSRLAAGETIQDIISFPPQIQRGHHYVPRQALLFTPKKAIHLLASIWPGQVPEVTQVKGSDLLYMEVTLILLYGFLEIVAPGDQSPARLGAEFNLVAWDLLSRPVRQLLLSARTSQTSAKEHVSFSPSVKLAVDGLPLKFFNGVRIHGLLPGEQLEDLVFQPGTWEHRLVFFRRAILPNTLILLTSNYLVVIQEELEVSQGWIITYIPRNAILNIQNQPCSQWNELSLQLERAGQSAQPQFRLTASAARTWHDCWTRHGGQWQDLPGEPV